jgi:hypothetical protein
MVSRQSPKETYRKLVSKSSEPVVLPRIAPPLTKKPRAATSTAHQAAHKGSNMDMHYAHHPLVAEDFVCCETTHASTSSDDKESSVTRDPDSISKALI